MRKRRDATPVPEVAKLKPDDLLTAAQAVALIANGDGRSDDDDRKARDRARKFLRDHLKRGMVAETHSDRFAVHELARWLHQVKPGMFDDLPAKPRIVSASGVASVGVYVRATGFALHGDLPSCHRQAGEFHARIQQLEEQNEDLRTKLREAQATAVKLQPDAESWRRLCERNRKSANCKRPR